MLKLCGIAMIAAGIERECLRAWRYQDQKITEKKKNFFASQRLPKRDIVKTRTDIVDACGIDCSVKHFSARRNILFSFLLIIVCSEIDVTGARNVISSFNDIRLIARRRLTEKVFFFQLSFDSSNCMHTNFRFLFATI